MVTNIFSKICNLIHISMQTTMSFQYFADLMIVYFDALVFTGSESSGNITVSIELIRHLSLMSGNINVIVRPSDQSPISAEGERCTSIIHLTFSCE